MKDTQTIEMRKLSSVPADVAVCPVCGAQLDLDVFEIESYPDGWRAEPTGFMVFCSKGHEFAYDDSLRIDGQVHKWLTVNYRFTEPCCFGY